MNIFALALRNIGRKRVRSAITIGSMAFAGFIMLFYSSLGEGFSYMMEKNVVAANTGDIQIHAPGYRSDPDLYARVPDPGGLLNILRGAGFNAVPRLYGFGLAAAGNSSAGVWMRGVDLVNEPKVTTIDRSIMEGKWLDADDTKGVVIGRKLARTLGADIGSEIVVVSQAADGSMANDLYKVRGILKSVGEAVDLAGFLMPEAEFRRLMTVPDGSHEIAMVRVDKGRDLTEATATVAALAPGMETRNWRDLQPVIAKLLDMMGTSIFIVLSIAYTAVGMVILNAMLMSVFERIHEFGVMKAIGVTPVQVFLLIMAEAFLEALIALAIALAAGIPFVMHFQKHGIDLTGFTTDSSFSGVSFEAIWYTRVTWWAVLSPVWFMFLVVAIAVLYPSLKATFLRPLDAIHHR